LLYFCDESHIRGHDYFAVGGLAIRPKRAAEISQKISELRINYGITRLSTQIEYKTASKRRDDIYRAYVDLLAAMVAEGQAHIHFRFTPCVNQRNENAAISKAFFQLMLHRAGRYYAKDCGINYRPDNGCCTEYLPKMRPGLNSKIREEYAVGKDAVSSIQPVESSKEHLLQLLDVTLGALTAARNNQHNNGGVGDYKKSLIEYTVEKLGVDVLSNSNIEEKKLNIWNVNPETTRLHSAR